MASTAAPISIYFTDTSQPESSENESATQASSIHTQFALRERYDFVWANQAERDAQTGMVQSSRGYQADTKTEYIFEGGTWRLALPYVEYSVASQSLANNAYDPISTSMAVNTGMSTSTTFTSLTSGRITLVDPGIYSLSLLVSILQGNGAGYSGGFVVITKDLAHADFVSISPFVSGVGHAVVPFFRTAVPNTILYLWALQSTGLTVNYTATLRVGRLG